MRAGFEPLPIGLEFQAELLVVDPQIAVPADHSRIGPDLHHLLRQHADINRVAAVIAKAIDADPVIEPAKERDVVLQPDVGPASAPATTTTAATAAAAASAAGTQATTTAAAAA